jgi:hypothetical protein
MNATGQHRSHVGKPPPRHLGWAAFVLALMLALGAGSVAGGWWGVGNLAYAARLTGTPGLFLVDHCASHGQGRQRTTLCYGSFRADDGQVLAAGPVTDGRLSGGARLPMQYHDRQVSQVGVAPIAGWVIVLSFAVAALSGALQLATVGVEFAAPAAGRRLRRAAWAERVRKVVGSAGAGALGVAMAAGVVFLVAHFVS